MSLLYSFEKYDLTEELIQSDFSYNLKSKIFNLLWIKEEGVHHCGPLTSTLAVVILDRPSRGPVTYYLPGGPS